MPLRIRQEVQKVLWPQLSQGTEPDAYSSIVIWMAVSQGMSRMISALDRHGRPRSSSCGRSSIGTSFNLVSTPMETQSMLGRVFTRLTVISEAPRANRKRRWHCSCSCGGTTTAYHWSLLAGRSRSCGCLKSEELNKWQAER